MQLRDAVQAAGDVWTAGPWCTERVERVSFFLDETAVLFCDQMVVIADNTGACSVSTWLTRH
jgi:hypothetical protein